MADNDKALENFSFDKAPLDASYLLDPMDVAYPDSNKDAAVDMPADWLERVKVTGPAIMRFSGYEETFAATLINLSGQGVACVAPTGLTTGDHLHLEFQPSPAQAPQIFLAQVVWTQAVDTEQALYGLRFVQLSVAASETLQTALQEYAKHHPHQQAQEHDLLLSTEDLPSLTADLARSAVSPWWWGIAGAAVGALLTLLVISSLWPQPPTLETGASLTQPTLPQVLPHQIETPPHNALADVPQPPVAVIQDIPADTAAATKAVVVDAVLPVSTPTVAMPPVFAGHKSAHNVTPKKAVANTQDSTVRWRHLQGLDIEEGKHHITLKLWLNGRAGKQQLFWLNSPRRLVVDVVDRQSKLSDKSVEVKHALVSRVRVGNHPHKVRFVVETSQDVDTNVTARAEGNWLVLQLRRQS